MIAKNAFRWCGTFLVLFLALLAFASISPGQIGDGPAQVVLSLLMFGTFVAFVVGVIASIWEK